MTTKNNGQRQRQEREQQQGQQQPQRQIPFGMTTKKAKATAILS
jgi:hypothetical protein